MTKALIIDLTLFLGTLLVMVLGILRFAPGDLFSLGLLLMIAILSRSYRQPQVNCVCALAVFNITVLFSLIHLNAAFTIGFLIRTYIAAIVFGAKAAIALWIGITIYRRLIKTHVI